VLSSLPNRAEILGGLVGYVRILISFALPIGLGRIDSSRIRLLLPLRYLPMNKNVTAQ
jgi:hypothetical protein